MRFNRTIGLQIVTFLMCFLMMTLQVAYVAKGLPKEHGLFTFMVVAGYVIWLAGFLVGCLDDNTVGLGMVTLSAFIIMVGCALPNGTTGALSELLIIYIPMLLVPVSLMVVRGGAAFKRVMLVTIGILYTIVSIYMIANSLKSLDTINSSYTLNGGSISSSAKSTKSIYSLQCAYSFFSLFYYLLMIICGGALFRNDDQIMDW